MMSKGTLDFLITVYLVMMFHLISYVRLRWFKAPCRDNNQPTTCQLMQDVSQHLLVQDLLIHMTIVILKPANLQGV